MEICSCKNIVDEIDGASKAAVLQVSPSVVKVITHDLPDEMVLQGRTPLMFRSSNRTYAFTATGIIIETRQADAIYFSTIITPANLFYRTNQLQPHQIPVEVVLSTGKLYKAHLEACDFHYNLAAITIQSDSPLLPATLTHLNDFTSVALPNIQVNRPFKMQRHSNSYKIQPGHQILFSTCLFSSRDETAMCCKELFSLKGYKFKCNGGDAVINYSGEVVGICFSNGSVFPVNLFSRWWDHYKCSGQFHRSSLGVTVVNLHVARTDFLNQFSRKFPNIVAGAFVTKVEKQSPAYRCGIKCNDVIIKCNGDLVRSKLEFLERVWDNAGRVVELTVLKSSPGEELNVNIAIGKTDPDKLYKWPVPDWRSFVDDNTASAR